MKTNTIRYLNLILIAVALFGYQDHAGMLQRLEASHEREVLAAQRLEEAYREMTWRPEEETEEETASGGYRDGTYEGTGTGYGGEVRVSVTVSDGAIISVKLLAAEQEDELYLGLASALLDTIVVEQRADLDVVSGATYSSGGILAAAAAALEQAGEG